jgi:hypothetical protein
MMCPRPGQGDSKMKSGETKGGLFDVKRDLFSVSTPLPDELKPVLVNFAANTGASENIDELFA